MKIEKLVIYGFGQHEQKVVPFSPGMNIIYGKNEAGKTTIQQFILHILFGFPPKNSPTLRYEPKSGERYGGQIHLQDDVFGRCIIERIRGKSAGDVTVYFEDGRKGGEEALGQLLRQYDRASFEAIFSFSLLQLQGFEKMDEEQLSRTLFASGTTGMDRLLQVEKNMTKEMGDLYKKSGRIPSINVKMEALRELELELERAHQESTQYTPTMNRLAELEGTMELVRAEIKELQQKLAQLEQLKQTLPLYEQRDVLLQQLFTLGEPAFPADGIRRYEMIAGRLTDIEAHLQHLQAEIETQMKLLGEHVTETSVAAYESLLVREAEWHQLRSLAQQLTHELQTLEDEIYQLRTRLGLQQESSLSSMDVSLQQEERLHQYLQQFDRIEQEKQQFQRQQHSLNNEQHDWEEQERSLQRQAPTNKEREMAKRWPSLRQQLAEAKAYRTMKEQSSTQPLRKWAIVVGLVAIVFMLLGTFMREQLLLWGGILIASIAVYFTFQSKRRESQDEVEEEWQDLLDAYEGKEQEMEQLLQQVQMYEQELQTIYRQQQQVERKKEMIGQQLIDLRDSEHEWLQSFQRFLAAYPFAELPTKSLLPELFRLLRELQAKERASSIVKQQLAEVVEQKHTLLEEAQSFLSLPVAEELVFEVLRTTYLQKKEQKASYDEAKRKKEQLLEKQAHQQVLMNRLLQERLDILKEANVETEEAYYEAYTKYEQSLLLTKQIATIEAQLSTHNQQRLENYPTQAEVVEQLKEHRKQLMESETMLQQLVEERAQLQQKIEHLLTNDQTSRQLQQFEMKKAELEEAALEWGARKLLISAIEQMISNLKEHRLPEVLQLASKLFQELTSNRYTAIISTEEGRFEAVTVEGIHYHMVELSQATKEQAYVSMRFALAKVLQEQAPFPLILDDPFVHFDYERFDHMMQWMNQLQQEHQILYFTCHKDRLASSSSSAHIIHVSALGTEQGAVTK